MVNIIEAGKAIEKERIVKLIADVEIYTIGNELSIVMQRLLGVIHSFARFMAKVMGKKWNKYLVAGWEERHREVLGEIENISNSSIEDVMLETFIRRLRIPKRYQKSREIISSYLVKYAQKGFKRGTLEGFSIPEKVEYIYEKYPHMKVKDERKTLFQWFLVFCLMVVICFMGMSAIKINKVSCIVLCVMSETIYAGYVSRKIKIRWVMHYIWLARTEYGRKLVEARLMLDGLEESKRIEKKEDLQLLHSYLWILKKEEEKLSQLDKEKQETERKIEKNLRRIEDLQDKGDSDIQSMKKNLWEENRILKQQISEIDEKIETAKSNISGFRERIEDENDTNAIFYQELWKEYSATEIDISVCVQIIDNLSFEDLSKVENRLYELNHTKEPLSLAEHKNGKDFISFRTEQGDIARIYFEYHKKTKKISILSFEREEILKIIPLTAEDIKRILERRESNGESSSRNYGDILPYLQRIDELDEETRLLRKEKYNADIKLQDCLKEISELNTNIENSAKRCKELEDKLKKVSNDKEQADKIIAEYEEKQAKFIQLSNDVAERKKELLQWKQKCDELSKKIQANDDSSKRMKEELEIQNQVLQDNINSLQSTLDFQNRAAEEAKKSRKADLQAIQKLESANEELKKTLKKSKNELARLEKKKEEFVKKQRSDQEKLIRYKERLAEANERARQSVETMREAQKGASTEKYYSTYGKIKEKYPLLSDEAVTFFSTAEQFFAAFEGNEGVDYSPIIVEYCKVLETSLWDYLEKSEEYKKEVDKCFATNHIATLGSAIYIISGNVNKSLGKYSEELKYIKEMRNDGAHKGVQGRTQTEKIKKYLWTSDLLIRITEK